MKKMDQKGYQKKISLIFISISPSSVEWRPKVYDSGQEASIQTFPYHRLPPLTSQAFCRVLCKAVIHPYQESDNRIERTSHLV